MSCNKHNPKRWLWLLLLPLLLGACKGKPEPKVLNEQNYSLEYDEDWYLDNYDEDFDPDYYFLISSKDQDAFVSMFFYDGPVDAAALLKEKAAQHLGQTITDTEQEPMNTWGHYQGKGMKIKGKIMGTEKAELNLFVYSGKHSFLVVTQMLSSDKRKYTESIDLIRNSFKLKD